MFEGPVTGNIPEVLDNGEVTDGTQLALVNTAASGNNAAAIQSLDDRVTAELASKLDSSALAPAIAPLATAAALATTDGQVAAHGSSIAALQSSLTTGLSNKADQSAFDVLEGVVATKSTPDSVDLKLSNYSTTAAMNGSIASANNATLATVAANYGLKTVVDQHSLDIAARITPLEVDTKVANALLGGRHRRGAGLQDATISGLQASKADASALTAYALQTAQCVKDSVREKRKFGSDKAISMGEFEGLVQRPVIRDTGACLLRAQTRQKPDRTRTDRCKPPALALHPCRTCLAQRRTVGRRAAI